MPSVEYKIDWITITKPELELWSDAEVAAFLHDFDGSQRWEKCAPPKGYSYAAKNEYGAIAACSGDRQGCILQWPGQALLLADAMQILSLAVLNDWKLTRLDANVDFLGFDTTVLDYQLEFECGQCLTVARKWNEEKSPNGGHTFYIGSRKSANFMRIYNKTAETARFTDIKDLPQKWVRVELRLGDEHARSAYGFIEAAGMTTAIPMLLRGYADFPNIEEYVNMAEYPISTIGKPAKATNTVKWILEGCLPTIIREIRLDPDLWQEIKNRVESELGLQRKVDNEK